MGEISDVPVLFILDIPERETALFPCCLCLTILRILKETIERVLGHLGLKDL